MLIPIFNAGVQNYLFLAVAAIAIAATVRRKTEPDKFSVAVTTELKGVAILLVVLSHIGYFLVTDHTFLAPLSNYAGVGVDLFLILSGYGIMTSALRHPLTIQEFYKKRLGKIWLPVAVTVLLFVATEYLFLNRIYPLLLTVKNLLGFFPSADLYNDLNSPLWFITPLLVQYILFPVLYWRRVPWLAPIVLAAGSFIVMNQDLTALVGITPGVYHLYKLHFLGFSAGLLLACIAHYAAPFLSYLRSLGSNHPRIIRLCLLLLIGLPLFFLLTSGAVGREPLVEQAVSLVTALLIILLFVIKKTEAKVLTLFGQYSFEIYLLHWPLLYRYQSLYEFLPAAAATLLYLSIFITLGWLYQKALTVSRSRKVSS